MERGRLVPAGTGTSGPEDRSRRLPLAAGRTARRTVTAQRAGTHPKARAQRRRNVAKRRGTIAAKFSAGVCRAQPVAASRALRVDALHSPSWQILHAFSPSSLCGMTRHFLRSLKRSNPPGRGSSRKKLPGVCAAALVVSREKIQSLVVGLPNRPDMAARLPRSAKKFPPFLLSSFTTFQGLPTICASIVGNQRRMRLRMRKGMRRAITGAFFLIAAMSPAFVRAQQPASQGRDPNAPDAPQPAGSASAASDEQKKSPDPAKAPPLPAPGVHRFWDRENDWLFVAVGAGRGLDYASTLNLRHRGINEAFLTNSVVDNHPLFAGIEVAATAASIGVSYIFHRTGHHRLERWTSAIHAGIAVGGAIRNYELKSPNAN